MSKHDPNRPKPIRNSAKALIISNGKLLLLRKNSGGADYYVFPGGGQHKEEPLSETVRRECLEEVGADVELIDLLFIRDYIGKNHEFSRYDSDLHQIEFFFLCALKTRRAVGPAGPATSAHEDAHDAPPELTPGHEPDTGQVGIEWLDLAALDRYPLYPSVLKAYLREMHESGYFSRTAPPARPPVYLGDVN